MYALSFTNRFEKDLKLIKKRSVKDVGVQRAFPQNFGRINYPETTMTTGNAM